MTFRRVIEKLWGKGILYNSYFRPNIHNKNIPSMNGEDTEALINNIITSQINTASQNSQQASDIVFQMWHNIGNTLLQNFGLGLTSIALTVTARVSATSTYTAALLKSYISGMAQRCNGTSCLKAFIKAIYQNYIQIVTQLMGIDAAGNTFQAIINPAYHTTLLSAIDNKIDQVLSQYNRGPYFGSVQEVIELHKKLALTLFKDSDYLLDPSDFINYIVTNPATGATTPMPFPGTAHPYL